MLSAGRVLDSYNFSLIDDILKDFYWSKEDFCPYWVCFSFLKKYNTDFTVVKRTYLLRDYKAWFLVQNAGKKKELYKNHLYFYISKMYTIRYYTWLIKEHGILDNLATDIPELLHNAMKNGY
jgi:hypothetical protein